MIPDPTPYYSVFWYFFKVETMAPGDYTFVIVGFFRDAPLHRLGVQPVALSMRGSERGIGWQRFGWNMNFWCSKKGSVPEYSLSFTFNVTETDTMYFAYLYPYTYTDLCSFLKNQPLPFQFFPVAKSHGGVEVLSVFWDADTQKFVNVKTVNVRRIGRAPFKKPAIVIAGRHHPGESNASYAMEGFIRTLFASGKDGGRLLKRFSFLILPMFNVDGVICGYYRPTLTGYDMNRSWMAPNRRQNPVEFEVLSLLDRMSRSRQIVFFLDFHGHSAQCNAFTYGVWDEMIAYNAYTILFPKLMARATSLFDEAECQSLAPTAFPATMRVALHHRYEIPFAYTLEMSFGGIDIGSKTKTQMTPMCYRDIGAATVKSIAAMLLDHVPLDAMLDAYAPPVVRALDDREV
jgi:hypothetical protein